MFKEILFSVSEDHIATISFNRPQFGNAFTWDMMDEALEAFATCAADDGIRAVILTGEGKNFSAGGDIQKFKRWIDAGKGLDQEGVRRGAALTDGIRSCPKPVIGKINGAAAGAGSALALACDFRVMTEKSKLVGGFVKMGFCGDSAGWYMMSRSIGLARTAEFYMLGHPMDGKEAYALGLANRLAEPERLDAETLALARELASGATFAIGMQKKMVNLLLYSEIPMLTELEKSYMKQCSLSADHAEAVNAFLEKRAPAFSGK